MSESRQPLLVKGGRVVVPDGDLHKPAVADVLVVGGTIAAIGPDLAREAAAHPGCRTVDARDRLVIPGFINAHYHSHDVLAKGTMEETPLETWRLLALPPQYPKRSREEIKVRTLLGALECLKSGMTTVQDMVTLFPFDPEHLSAVVEAYEEIGIRAVIALQYADRKGIGTIPFWRDVFPPELHDTLSTAAEPDAKIDQIGYFEETYLKSGTHAATIGWALGPSAPERCTPALIERTRELAERYDLQIFTHFYESKGMALQARIACPEHGGSLVRELKAQGLTGPRLNLAHSVWLTEDEIEILAETGTRVVLNPLSNLKLKSGVPPVRRLQQAGVRFGLGCDNCSCSDAQNMFEAMKFAAMVTAIADHEPGPPQSDRLFHAATAGGAGCVGRDDLGAIAIGNRADLVLIDLADPSFVPLNSAVRQLVYTEAGRGVRTVIVEGRVVLEDGRAVLVDESELFRRVEAVMPEFTKDFEAIRLRVDGLQPYLAEAHRRIWAEDVGEDRLFHERHGRRA